MSATHTDKFRIDNWNLTSRPFRSKATITDLVTEAAVRWPERPALVDERGVAYTHRELYVRANQIANLLCELGLGKGSFVAFLGGHTPEAIACLLGILKTGAAYVPLDPHWPRLRLLSILEPLRVHCLVHGRDQLNEAVELAWGLPSLRHLVCPEISDQVPPPERLNDHTVRELWNHVASSDDELQAFGFNIRPNEEYATEEIAAYRDRVASLVWSVSGKGVRVLEVGCGAGLILRELARSASRCVGVDPSPVALARNREWAMRAGVNAEFVEGFAHEVPEKITGPFEVVVLASVVQFFPGVGYFAAVVSGLAELLTPDGALIIADVIDPASGRLPGGLRLAPAFFSDLALSSGVFSHVDVHRRDSYEFAGELATRYDVILKKGQPRGLPVKQIWTGWHVAMASTASAHPSATADDPAYVIFTSGSTGQPKGVMVQHRPVVNLIEWVNRTYLIQPTDRLLFVTSFCFDLSVYDMFGTLAAGASVRIVRDDHLREPEALLQALESEPITFWDSAPAALVSLLAFARLRKPERASGRLLVFLSGDWVPVSLPGELRSRFPCARLVVLGGATEATVWSNHFPVIHVQPDWPSIPYGKPIQNVRYYVLGEALDMCSIGEEGDLYIAGDCLSIGYLGDPRLTACRFLPDPYAPVPGSRMYATGDRARWLEDGNLQFLGRLDDQVKIRGYRIELGEVQAALNKHPQVVDSVVLAVGSGSTRRLAGFVLAPSRPDAAELIQQVRNLLPEAMVPSTVTVLDSFPLGATGKTDRASLREMADQVTQTPYRSPVNELEPAQVVRQLWTSTFGREYVHDGDDFFALGGHSLLAVQLVTRVREILGVEFELRELFEHPHLADMVSAVEARLARDGASLPK